MDFFTSFIIFYYSGIIHFLVNKTCSVDISHQANHFGFKTCLELFLLGIGLDYVVQLFHKNQLIGQLLDEGIEAL
jgi:hypothetical protein